jgi:hypothetical protein
MTSEAKRDPETASLVRETPQAEGTAASRAG